MLILIALILVLIVITVIISAIIIGLPIIIIGLAMFSDIVLTVLLLKRIFGKKDK